MKECFDQNHSRRSASTTILSQLEQLLYDSGNFREVWVVSLGKVTQSCFFLFAVYLKVSWKLYRKILTCLKFQIKPLTEVHYFSQTLLQNTCQIFIYSDCQFMLLEIKVVIQKYFRFWNYERSVLSSSQNYKV